MDLKREGDGMSELKSNSVYRISDNSAFNPAFYMTFG